MYVISHHVQVLEISIFTLLDIYCIIWCELLYIYIYIQIQLCVIGSQLCYISAFCHVIVKKCHVASQDANVLASCGGCSILGFLRKLNRYIALKWDILSTTNPKYNLIVPKSVTLCPWPIPNTSERPSNAQRQLNGEAHIEENIKSQPNIC